MNDFSSDIDAALLTDKPVAKDKVILWIESASDLANLSRLYRLTSEAYFRIQPDLGGEATCDLIQRYLLQCIRENVTDNEEIQSRYEAAATLHTWFCHLGEIREDNSAILRRAADAITELFLASDEDVRNAIETGFLEHVLEMATLRPYFEHWAAATHLCEAWNRALEWGKAHPDFTWRLLQEFKRSQQE